MFFPLLMQSWGKSRAEGAPISGKGSGKSILNAVTQQKRHSPFPCLEVATGLSREYIRLVTPDWSMERKLTAFLPLKKIAFIKNCSMVIPLLAILLIPIIISPI